MSILDSVDLFDSLNNEEKETLSLFCQERFLRSGEVLFEEWNEAIALYVVKSGSLKVYKTRSEGETILGYIGAGNLVGEMAFFDSDSIHQKRFANVKAIDDTILLTIMNYAILELSKKHSEIYEKISQTIKKRKNVSL